MNTWEETAKLVNALWPEFHPNDETRTLWRDSLVAFEQETLHQAIRQVRVDSAWREPVLRDVISAYRQAWQRKAEAAKDAKRAAQAPEQPNREAFEQPPVDAERRLVEEFTGVIEAAQPSEFATIEGMVLDRLGKGLSSVAAYRLLVHARRRLLGQTGPGLSAVGRDGSLRPLAPAGGRP